MKKVDLLYKTEEASLMLVYHYDVHAWKYDCKFWLIGDKWCTDLSGNIAVGKLHDRDLTIIKQFAPMVEQREKENSNWLAFQKCRKRTCLCKVCKKICNCNLCVEKIDECNELLKD